MFIFEIQRSLIEAKNMYCKECGKYIDDDSKFCKYCGKKQYTTNLSTENPGSQENIPPSEINFPEYDFPKRLYDFYNNQEIEFGAYRELEQYIQTRLKSNEPEEIKNGLSNVLYWGYYRIGYRDERIKRFRDKVTESQLKDFARLVIANRMTPINIKKIGLPQFSGLSFVSKILMFFDPRNFVVLDKKIMQLSDPTNRNNDPITKIGNQKSGIRITEDSQKHYIEWCNLCKKIATHYLNSDYAVDAERGFFKLVENNQLDYGRKIIVTLMENNNLYIKNRG